MTKHNNRLTAQKVGQFLREINGAAAQEHIPESVLRDYLTQEEIEEEIENHLLQCEDCLERSDKILEEESPWRNDPERVRHLKETILSRTQEAVSWNTRHLVTALDQLASVRQELNKRLAEWREQLERGAVRAEVTLRTVLVAGRAGTMEVVPAMSHSSLQFAPAEMGFRVKGGETVGAGQPASAVVITTDAMPSVKFAIEEDTVVVTFLEWQAPSPPLVVLVPEDELSKPRTPDRLDREDDRWVARLERVPTGAYLLAIAPISK